MNDERNTGIYHKFNVFRVDGTDQARGDKHFGCSLFVLDISCDPFARDAALAYADSCSILKPKLASDLRAMVDKFHAEHGDLEANVIRPEIKLSVELDPVNYPGQFTEIGKVEGEFKFQAKWEQSSKFFDK